MAGLRVFIYLVGLLCVSAEFAVERLPSYEYVRKLLYEGKFKAAVEEAKHASTYAPPTTVAALSDVTLAEWFASDKSVSSANKALDVFLNLASNLEYPIDVRIAVLRNAQLVENTKDGKEEKWANFPRAFDMHLQVKDMFRQLIEGAMQGGLPTKPTEIPLTHYDVGINGQVCMDPSSAPSDHFICGDREQPLNSMQAGSNAEKSAHTFLQYSQPSSPTAQVVGGGGVGSGYASSAGSYLYLDLMRRALTDYLTMDLTQEADMNILKNTRDLANGEVSCSDLEHSVCESALSLAHSGFGLSVLFSTEMKAHTSLPFSSLSHLQICVEHILRENIPGDLIEAGVFRGGATIFLRAILAAHGVQNRKVFVADSFQGIPPSRRPVADGSLIEECDRWEERYAIPFHEVRSNFRRYGLLDDKVEFVKGFFNDSLPPIFGNPDTSPTLALVRIDADAYDGVRDALESLYPRLSPGGIVIIDDWHLAAAAAAGHEYRTKHGITSPIFIAPSDFVHTCSVGGSRMPSPIAPGMGAGPHGIASCEHPTLSYYLHNKHLVMALPPHVAYWIKD